MSTLNTSYYYKLLIFICVSVLVSEWEFPSSKVYFNNHYITNAVLGKIYFNI